MNGEHVPCDSDNGWKLAGEDTVQLTATACSSFASESSSVYAMFPCEVFRPD
jgi:hypothetical protein